MISGWYLWWIFTLFTMSSGTNLSQVEVSLPSNCSGTIPISSAAVFCFMNMFDWMIGHIIGVLKNEPPCYMDGHCWSWSWNKFLARIIIYAVVLGRPSLVCLQAHCIICVLYLHCTCKIYNMVRHPQSPCLTSLDGYMSHVCLEYGRNCQHIRSSMGTMPGNLNTLP